MKRLACVLFELEDDESIDAVIQKIEALSHVKVYKNAIRRLDWKKQMANIMNRLGISANCGGYKMLFEAVELAANTPHISMQAIYSELSQKYKIGESAVASQMRYVISKITEKNSVKQINYALGVSPQTTIKLTTSGFVRYLVTILF